MGTARTEFTINAKVQGFAQAQRGLGGLGKETTNIFKQQLKGSKDSSKMLKKMKEDLKGLTQVQGALLQTLKESGAVGSKSYREIDRALKDVTRDAIRVERVVSSMDKALGKAGKTGKSTAEELKKAMGKGGFAQGLLQGIAPGAAQGLQRGPGMRRQAFGMALGGAARGAAGSMFGGIGALAQGLQSIRMLVQWVTLSAIDQFDPHADLFLRRVPSRFSCAARDELGHIESG